MGIERAETVARMRKAFRGGLSASAFFKQERKAERPLYRRTDMLADWRTINQLETKKDLLRYVRRDRYPTEKTMASVQWELSKEYMYKVKVFATIRPGEPITEKFVNIMSDIPMTPEMIEAELIEQRQKEEQYAGEQITGLQVWTAIRRVS